MATKHKPGTMAAADAKNEKLFNGAFSIVLIAIVLITVFAKGTYFHHYFSNASFILKLIGFLLVPTWLYLVWFVLPEAKISGGLKGAVMFGGMALIMLFLFGFNLAL